MTTRAVIFDAYGTLFDVASLTTAAETAFPGHGTILVQLWRQKQLEYTWLRSLMGAWVDFEAVTAEALRYALRALALDVEQPVVATLCAGWRHLDPYPDASATLRALGDHVTAILSNGSRPMLEALVANSGLEAQLDAVLSVDAAGVSKPHPATYALVTARLGVAPAEVLFVSANPFDVVGGRQAGFEVAWIDRRRPADAMQVGGEASGPQPWFPLLRACPEELGHAADHRLACLADLVPLLRAPG